MCGAGGWPRAGHRAVVAHTLRRSDATRAALRLTQTNHTPPCPACMEHAYYLK